MIWKKQGFIVFVLSSILMVGAWAVVSPSGAQNITPQDFDDSDTRDYPVTSTVDVEIKGLASIGEVYMLEGIDNETTVTVENGKSAPGGTRYARLVFHGVFDKKMRDWRDEIIAGTVNKRDIWVDIRNKSGSRVLRVIYKNCWPARLTLPPLSIESSTRYMERYEFAYDSFELTD
ncbi:MAG: phage tail protein [Candidatus Hinthialibacter antarcticus]|nr:phage tail protein [Candidatus Hinthialibacter antarcticus]